VERVLILGSPGAGKSTLARRLAERTGLPVIHLDAEYWQPGWVEPEPAAWAGTVSRLVERPRWIMDGNYGGTRAIRIAAADTAIYLDYPPRCACGGRSAAGSATAGARGATWRRAAPSGSTGRS
jgi:adenylate kinase family enzyme